MVLEMTNNNLKPCPFCGNKVEVSFRTNRGAHRLSGIIECCIIRVVETTMLYHNETGAQASDRVLNCLIEKWNPRSVSTKYLH